MTQRPRLRQPAHDMVHANEVPGMHAWLWTFLPAEWVTFADRFALELARGVNRAPTAEGRHRDAQQPDHILLGARGVVAYFLATGQAVPPLEELLRRDREKCAEAHHYKIRSARNLTQPDYGFIWHERDTQYRGVSHFLLMTPCLENDRQWGLVGVRGVEDARELSIEGTWLPTENKVLSTVHFLPYKGARDGPPAPFEYCKHGEEIGRRCFICDPLRLDLFPPREYVAPSKQQRLHHR